MKLLQDAQSGSSSYNASGSSSAGAASVSALLINYQV
jgi:hypothetical protein